MSSVVLVISSLGPESAKCAALLSKAFSIGIAEIKKSVERGAPVFERKLFDRNDASFPMRFSEVLSGLDALQCEWKAFELPSGQEWNPSGIYFQITTERMQNMSAAHQKSLEQQRRLGELENEGS